MTGRFSQQKGKRAEREIINLLQPIVDKIYGMYPLIGTAPFLQRNTLQSDRGGFDIVGLDWFAPEVKFQEQLAVNSWWEQTVRQTAQNQTPVLFYRKSRQKWRVVMKLYAQTDSHNHGERFFTRAEISIDHFLIYFEYRLHSELRAKSQAMEWLPGLDTVR